MSTRTLSTLQLAAAAILVVLSSCRTENPPTAQGSGATPPPADLFVDIAGSSGISFRHDNGGSGELYFVEPVGPGGALADLDDDGDLDVVLVQGGRLATSGDDPLHSSDGGLRIYRNDLRTDESGRPVLRFTDVTSGSGLRAVGYGMGVASGDFDDDGRIDLYFTCFGSNQLWRNVGSVGTGGTGGDIRFEEVTAAAGVDDARWSTSASFADVDGDGDLDLYVTNYVDFRLENHRPCRSSGGRQDFCGPSAYNGESDRLFLNRGDGTFANGSGPSGVLSEPSSGLGVVAADFDRDGLVDLYVANDLRRNHLWRNLGRRDSIPRFENVALEAGVAVSMLGRAQASMGVVAGDLDQDGDDDLFTTHLTGDTNTLYINDGAGSFVDRTAAGGLGAPSLELTGFGTALLDVDNDGTLDVIVANGAVKAIQAQADEGDPYPLNQRNQLFRNRGDGTFVEISSQAGVEFARMEVSRGVAVGDVDNDGRSDVLLTNNRGPARLLRNQSDSGHAWLGLRLRLREGGRDALGARVAVHRADGTTLWRRVATDGSYLSAGDPRLLVGLGSSPEVDTVEVIWPGGATEVWHKLEPGRYHTLVAGQGQSVPTSGGSPHPGTIQSKK